MTKKATLIGSGFSSLSAACYLSKSGYEVTVLEKNDQPGGRARKFSSNGFTFDMGPSWYWMPDIFESFFNDFDSTTSDFYQLVRLSPSYQVFFPDGESVQIPSDLNGLCELFERYEKGAAIKVKLFLREAEIKYRISMNDLVLKPGNSFWELINWKVAKGASHLHLFTSFHKYIRKYFSHPKIHQLLEFPVLFLGAMPKDTPSLYSLMNYADMKLGTWYPMGGMSKISEAMVSIAEKQGVLFRYNEAVTSLTIKNKKIDRVLTQQNSYATDFVLGGADYHHIEQNIIPKEYRSYSQEYWNKKVMAPSCLIYFLGVNKRIKNLLHHNLFFDTDFTQHGTSIYKTKDWPSAPQFYVCVTSKTDPGVADAGNENIFILIPVAAGLSDTEEIKEKYFQIALDRIHKKTGEKLAEHIIFKKTYAYKDFVKDYHSFKGNAYGLANTLMQTAFLRPKIKSNRISNMFYAGQLTVPGPGVPPAILSGKIAANEIIKNKK